LIILKKIDGELNSYDGSGYVLDFEKNTTFDSFSIIVI